MLITQSPRPEDRSRAEHEGATLRISVQRQIMCSGARPNRVAVIQQQRVDRERCRGQVNKTGRAKAIVGRNVPFIAKDVLREGERVTRLRGRDVGEGVTSSATLWIFVVCRFTLSSTARASMV